MCRATKYDAKLETSLIKWRLGERLKRNVKDETQNAVHTLTLT